MKLVCISDTHRFHRQLEVPEGDVLIHAGDFSNNGGMTEVKGFLEWFHEQPHPYKIFIAGNHDRTFEKKPEKMAGIIESFPGLHYLEDRAMTVEGLRFYGSPWTPEFCNWAFNVKRGELHKKWDRIPQDVDVLVTHGPPSGGLGGLIDPDRLPGGEEANLDVGDEELLSVIMKVKPRIHVCGHIASV